MKHRHPSFGPKKIRDRLRAVVPEEAWPVDSTVGVILKRAGWVRLGIRPERIRPGTPSENGRHERMHRALNAAVDRPPAMLGHNNAGSRRLCRNIIGRAPTKRWRAARRAVCISGRPGRIP